MQFTTFLATAVVLAMASSGLAACTYETGNYVNVCRTGNGLFCGTMIGDGKTPTGFCPEGKTEDFDATATKANKDACKGLQFGNSCTETVRCC
jgi:hypothetical protein